ncbi:NCOA7 [Symbiodinium microadriaticum]|nr:NCOA7 [Symbiodinium microadriaticum]
MPMKGPIGGGTPTSKGAKVDPVPATTAVDRKAAAGVEESFTYDSLPGIEKTCLGISSRVYGEKEVMILNKTEIQMLEDALPIDMQCCDWDLTYSLLRDGASLETLLRSSGSSQRTILVIEDAKGRKFGGIICDDAWRMSGEHYYGSGTCQVFTFRPIGSGETYGTTLEVYPATMKNEYYMLLSTDCIG